VDLKVQLVYVKLRKYKNSYIYLWIMIEFISQFDFLLNLEIWTMSERYIDFHYMQICVQSFWELTDNLEVYKVWSATKTSLIWYCKSFLRREVWKPWPEGTVWFNILRHFFCGYFCWNFYSHFKKFQCPFTNPFWCIFIINTNFDSKFLVLSNILTSKDVCPCFNFDFNSTLAGSLG
jgi:hypothetical protein